MKIIVKQVFNLEFSEKYDLTHLLCFSLLISYLMQIGMSSELFYIIKLYLQFYTHHGGINWQLFEWINKQEDVPNKSLLKTKRYF